MISKLNDSSLMWSPENVKKTQKTLHEVCKREDDPNNILK